MAVPTVDGPAELVLDEADEPAAGLLLGHGAGSDIDGWDLELLASRLPALGISVARFRQPYRVAGRKVFSSKLGLDRGWAAARSAIADAWAGRPLFVGGHSAGARTACRGFTAVESGLVLLSFPLHPPGHPARSRIEELAATGGPALVIQGEKDGFGSPGEVSTALDGAGVDWVRLVGLPGAGHPLRPTAGTTVAAIAERERVLVWSVAGFVSETLASSQGC